MRRSKVYSLILTLIIAVFVVIQRLPAHETPADGQLHIAYLDVGQGDSAVITTPSSTVYMIDTGPETNVMKVIGKELPQGKSIAGLFLTHPHSDHIAGTVAMLDRNPVETLYYTGVPHTTPTFFKTFESVQAHKIPVHLVDKPESFTTPDGVKFEILFPAADMRDSKNWILHGDELNDTSIVVKVTYKSESFLFMGDASEKVEDLLLKKHVITPVNVLKLGHHGSRTASSAQFLEATRPEYAILSLGKGNDYGHPHPEVVARLATLHIPYGRTDTHGTIHISSDGYSFTVDGERVSRPGSN